MAQSGSRTSLRRLGIRVCIVQTAEKQIHQIKTSVARAVCNSTRWANRWSNKFARLDKTLDAKRRTLDKVIRGIEVTTVSILVASVLGGLSTQ